jgi:hypothetical protein
MSEKYFESLEFAGNTDDNNASDNYAVVSTRRQLLVILDNITHQMSEINDIFVNNPKLQEKMVGWFETHLWSKISLCKIIHELGKKTH